MTIDTLGAFNTTTHRYTPTIAGTYLFGVSGYIAGTSNSGYPALIAIRLNTTVVLEGTFQHSTLAGAFDQAASYTSGPVTVNGTTDFIDFTIYSDTGTPVIQFGALTYAWGVKIS